MRFSSVSLSYDPGTVPVGIPMTPLVFPIDALTASSPFVLMSVEGLDPPEVDLSITSTVASGSVLQGRRPQDREIILTIGYQPNYAAGETVGDLRSQLYAWMTPKFGLALKLSLLNSGGSTIVYTFGHIKRVEADIFSKDPQTVITFTALSPYLSQPDYTVPGPFTFSGGQLTVTNPGNAPSSFYIKFTLGADSPSVTIADTYGNALYFLIVFPYGFSDKFLAGDQITIDTTPGRRMAEMKRGSTTYNILMYQQSTSKWLQLHNGPNILVGLSGTTINSFIIYPKYWGV